MRGKKRQKQKQVGKRDKLDPKPSKEKYRLKHEIIRDAFEKYHRTVNMTYNELLQWSKGGCSKQAGLTRNPVKRNLTLLRLPKYKWTMKHVRWANKTRSFIKRMKNVKQGKVIKGCNMSKRDIALKNWGYNQKK